MDITRLLDLVQAWVSDPRGHGRGNLPQMQADAVFRDLPTETADEGEANSEKLATDEHR
jgi:hypothetical protein